MRALSVDELQLVAGGDYWNGDCWLDDSGNPDPDMAGMGYYGGFNNGSNSEVYQIAAAPDGSGNGTLTVDYNENPGSGINPWSIILDGFWNYDDGAPETVVVHTDYDPNQLAKNLAADMPKDEAKSSFWESIGLGAIELWLEMEF